MVRVFIAGEGPNDLAVVEALLRKIHPEPWEVTERVYWRSIRKFKAGDHARKEERNVRGAALQAMEASCDLLAFIRDRDGDRERERLIFSGIEQAREDGHRVVGGVPVENLEAWILAACGERQTEEERNHEARLAARGIAFKATAEYVATIVACDLDAVPQDAKALHAFVASTRAHWPSDESATK